MTGEEIHFCPRCGNRTTLATKFGRQRPVCPQCGWIYFADPKVAVAVLIQQAGQVLLVQRANEPYLGRWTLPAGFVDAGEDPARAAERECLEETGLRVRTSGLIDVIAGQEHPRGADILIIYRGEILSGELKSGDDASDANFFSLHHLPPLAFTSTISILSSIQD